MQLENSFSVRAPIDVVWAALLDIERVAPCVPGARLLERTGADTFGLELDVALDGASASYQGEAAIVEHAAADRRVLLTVTGTEAGGGGAAEARIELRLAQAGDLTEGLLSGELALTGEAGRVAAEAIRGASAHLLDSFARNLAVLLGGGAATVNGSAPEAAVAHPLVDLPPLEPPPSRPPAGRPVAARGAASPGRPVEAISATAPVGDPAPAEPEWATPRASPAATGWAGGAARPAGATIERLRRPVGVMAIGLLLVAGVVGQRRRVRRVSRAVLVGESAGPVVEALAEPRARSRRAAAPAEEPASLAAGAPAGLDC